MSGIHAIDAPVHELELVVQGLRRRPGQFGLHEGRHLREAMLGLVARPGHDIAGHGRIAGHRRAEAALDEPAPMELLEEDRSAGIGIELEPGQGGLVDARKHRDAKLEGVEAGLRDVDGIEAGVERAELEQAVLAGRHGRAVGRHGNGRAGNGADCAIDDEAPDDALGLAGHHGIRRASSRGPRHGIGLACAKATRQQGGQHDEGPSTHADKHPQASIQDCGTFGLSWILAVHFEGGIGPKSGHIE